MGIDMTIDIKYGGFSMRNEDDKINKENYEIIALRNRVASPDF